MQDKSVLEKTMSHSWSWKKSDADFNYMKSINIGPPENMCQLDLNDFVGPKWVNDDTDTLWCKNYLVNIKKGVKSFPKTKIGQNKICVMVGASPAVLKHIDLIKTLDSKFIVVACNTVLKKLIQEDCRVDYVFTAEARDHIKSDLNIRCNGTELVGAWSIEPTIFDEWQGKKWFYQMGGGIKFNELLERHNVEEPDIAGGNSVSTSICWAYKYLSCRDFILIGTSFCYYDQYYFDNRSAEYVCKFVDDNNRIKAVDIYGKLVNVTPGQLSYKIWLENFIRYTRDSNFTNSTEDGILGVMPKILNFDGEQGQYTIEYLPWINIVPFATAIKAYDLKFKEI